MVVAVWHWGSRPLFKQMLCDCGEAFWAPVCSGDCNRDKECLFAQSSRSLTSQRPALICRG